ncbi:uncharacterized protein LOC133901446 [Phragmites australis]|uniref:uncharacterized protein LOC133901446 n=1 Tax=Phragmites australis TaxID=29695 RepID=UPI002D78FA10|nr:uncharacterized protein LOC133901446 [Phragmites australis]
METIEQQDSPPLLDPSLAPLMLFDAGRDGGEPEEENGGARLVYSIPKRRLLLARELDRFIDDVTWITPQGWMLMLDPATRTVSLLDPFTSRRVHLPPDLDSLVASSDNTRCVMSTHRLTDPGCIMLVIHLTDPVLCYCRPGGSWWFRHEYRLELLVVDDCFDRDSIIGAVVRLTAVGGRFYTHWDDKLGTLEFSSDPTLSCSHVVDRWIPAGYYLRAFQVESCGDLFRFGVSMSADKVGLKANCIYFMNQDDKGLYVYNMEQGTTTLHNPTLEIPDSMEPILLMPAT